MSASNRSRDFSLSGISWGYRDIFRQTIQRLYNEGYLGPEREEITNQFFALMRCSEESLYDHVLKEFLDSLTGDTAWIFDLPAIFGEIVRTGSQFAEAKMFYGIEFYRILKNGGFGDSPEKVQFLLTWLKKLKSIDFELAFAFLNGFQVMLGRLHLAEISLFAEEGIRQFQKNTQRGIRFLEGKLAGAESYFAQLTSECRLNDAAPVIKRLLQALSSCSIEVASLSALNDDGPAPTPRSMVCLYPCVYLPDRIRSFSNSHANRRWYMLQAVVASGMYLFHSVPLIHGRAGFSSLLEIAERDLEIANIAAIVEYMRVLEECMKQWPGSRGLIRNAMKLEGESQGKSADGSTPESLLFALADHMFGLRVAGHETRGLCDELVVIIRSSSNVLGTVQSLSGWTRETLRKSSFRLDIAPLQPLSFLPDFFYTADAESRMVVNSQSDSVVADLREEAGIGEVVEDDFDDAPVSTEDADTAPTQDAADTADATPAEYLYDEWSNDEGDYFRDYCHVHEVKSRDESEFAVPESASEQVRRVRRIFELLRPEVSSKLKRLSEGDEINHDLLVRYLVESERDPSPKIDFYEQPHIVKRDLSVLILLDTSGSTEEEVAGEKILEIEKHAGLILGQGLASLGDRFAVCGFSGNGREQCHFFIFKDFSDEWGNQSIANLYGARSASSTRIGAALRHAGFRIRQEETKQRLIILVTDGRPMDQAYDPETRYAQYDVRMACEENRRNSIYTFCISTMENSRGDMEIMFPERRYSILRDISHLPKVLPELYIRLTT